VASANLIVVDDVNIVKNELQSIRIYPNPTTGELRIEVINGACPIVENVEIFDVYGNIIKSKIVNLKSEIAMDISALQAGLYFVKITTENGTLTKKVVKY
jgi:hypothetical protein